MQKKITIKDIAREMNTAYSTVSRALNNKSGISEKKRQEILFKAKEMGYEPNLVARQLQGGASNTVGLVVPRINRDFFSNVIHGIESEAKVKGYNIIICQSNENLEDEEACIRTLLTNNVAGILMSLSIETERAGVHKEIAERKLPFVMFDRVFTDMEVNKVMNDNFFGAHAVTKHMIEQGYSDIIHFAGPLSVNIYKERADGFRSAMEEAGLVVSEEKIIVTDITKKSGGQAVNDLLNARGPFDGIFAASDFLALGALQTLQENRISVPEEVGVAGYANEPFTDMLNLTSVDQHSIELGRSAARLLFEEIESGQAKQMKKELIIKPEIKVRQSTQKSIQL